MPRKKRIAILVSSITLVILIIFGILGFLYLETDAFKSNETLFAKYLMQNFEFVEMLNDETGVALENTLNNNKYISEIEGEIQYTENIGTSDENKNSSINDVGIKIKSNIDRQNNYNYKDISIGTEDEDLVKLEYLKQDQNYGIRLNGIQQFVSIENNEDDEIVQEIEIKDIEALLSKIDINSIFNFTEEEKQSLINTYIGIVQSNVTKDKYYRQSNSLITVNNQDLQTNSYYIKLTIEEYNNLYIKILEQIIKDEIILSRIDLIEDIIKEEYEGYEQEKALREIFIDSINNEIEEIQNNNIGSEEVKIVVYESDMKTVRTSIEKSTEKVTMDLYNNSSIKISNVKLGENTNEQFIKIEKNNSETQSNILVEFEKIEDNEITKDIQLDYQQVFENNKANKVIELKISNEKYEGILNIEDNIELVQEFDNQITLDIDNIKLNDLAQEQVDTISGILNENIQNQLTNLFSTVKLEDYTKMLQNLEIIKQKSVYLPDEVEVTDVERKRFNSQFEFFVSENLTSGNIKDLIQAVESNFYDMKILLKNGEIQELDVEKLNQNDTDGVDYNKNISEILIVIKENSENKQKEEDTLKVIEKNSSNKYTVSLQYNDDGLVEIVRVKIQED